MPNTTSDPEQQGRLLLALASRVTGTLDLQEVLDHSLNALRELVDFGGGAIQLIDDGHLVAAATDPPISEEAKTVRIPVGAGISGRIAATGRADYVPDLSKDERIPEEARKKGVSSGVRCYYGVPLIAEGHPIGVVQIDAPRVDAFGPHERGLLLAFVPTIAAAVQNARLFSKEREVTARLVEADRMKSDFVAIVSHELRTPLTIMLGMTGTLSSHADKLDVEQIRELANRSNGAARRLRRLIDDLLYAGNLDRGFLAVHPVPTSLPLIFETLKSEHQGGDHTLEFDLDDDLPMIFSDADRLQQLLSNLVGNAEKYSPAGTTVTVRARRLGEKVSIEVEDEGRGIPVEKREAIFQLFYQTEDHHTRAEGGLGIGLYVVKRLCDAMDAPIAVLDGDGGGTCFQIQFLAADQAQPVSPSGPQRDDIGA